MALASDMLGDMSENLTDSSFHSLVRLWVLRVIQGHKGYWSNEKWDCRELLAFLREDAACSGIAEKSSIVEEMEALRRKLEYGCCVGGLPLLIQDNLRVLRDAFHLSDLELEMFLFLAYLGDEATPQFISHALIGERRGQARPFIEVVAQALAISLSTTHACLGMKSRLVSCGLVSQGDGICRDYRHIVTQSDIGEKLIHGCIEIEDLFQSSAMPSPRAQMARADFDHMKEVVDDLFRYLDVALMRQLKGVNVLLYGPPGTGKTELSRMLAQWLNCKPYDIVYADKEGDPKSPLCRMQSLRMAQTMHRGQRVLLVFDEVEDVFAWDEPGGRRMSVNANRYKQWMNHLLEENPVPVVWISNSNECIHQSLLRRFDMVIQVPAIPQKHRIKSYERITGGVVSASVLKHISEYDALTPAVVSRAAKVTRCIHSAPSADADRTFLRLVHGTMEAQRHTTKIMSEQTGPLASIRELYDVHFLRTDVSLDSILAQLSAESSCRICLYGPPGTGKTSLGHWIAKKLQMPILCKKASDLLSMYVGGTEHLLAHCFREAHQDRAILMIDEIDTFLQNRERATHQWEVSQVNELLVQMEQFNGIFIASTNLMEGLDRASLRRFDLKIRFDYLTPEQSRKLLTLYMKALKLPKATKGVWTRVEGMPCLTPGDFANVARQYRFRRFTSAAEFVEALEAECQLKEPGDRRITGFGQN
jgi:transitional endoplasmic reticulum ATPase